MRARDNIAPRQMRWLHGITLLILACCISPSAQAEGTPISVQLKWKHQFQFAGYYIALEKGYYRDAGLDVTLIEGGPNRSAIDHVLQHEAAYGVTSTGALIEQSHGKTIVALGAIFQHSPLLLLMRKNTNIRTLKDLSGKRIMLQSGYQNADIVAMLSHAALQEKDFIRQDISYNLDDLINKRTDAYAAYATDQPYQLKRQSIPYRTFQPKDYGVDFYGDIIITSEKEVRTHPERVDAFMQATIRGWNDALEQMDEAIDLILLKYNTQHLSREQLQFEAVESKKLMMPDVVGIGYMNNYRWQRIAQTYADQGLLPHNYPLSSFLYQPKPSLWVTLKQNSGWLLLLLLGLLTLHIILLRQTVKLKTRALADEQKVLLANEQFDSDQQSILLQALDHNVPLHDILENISRAIQRRQGECLCSILLLDDSGQHLIHAAAPDLPEPYCQAINGVTIGPKVGSCGTAAYLKKQVIVTDIAHDPLWEDYKTVALQHALAACWSQPITTAGGEVLGTFAMYYDHPCSPHDSDIRLIERAATLAAHIIQNRKSEQETARLAEIIEAMPDLVGISDLNGNIAFMNHAGRRMLELPDESDLSTTHIAACHPMETMQQLHAQAFPMIRSKEGLWRGQTLFLTQSGREFITDQVLFAHRDRSGEITHYVTIARDISERIKAEQEQKAIQAQIEHTQRLESLGVLAGGIAHDFNNILTAIMGNADLAQRAAGHEQNNQKYLGNIITSSEKAAELCRQMLAYSGKGKFVIKSIDLSSMVREITSLLEVSIGKAVRLQYDLAQHIPAIEADPAQLQQVIMNLVINASDAIGEHSGVISIRTGMIHVDHHYQAAVSLNEPLPEGDYVFLEVSDTGCGMDQQTQDKIFEPFYTTKFTGQGLGMSAVLGIIRGHQGAIHLYSEPGQGTLFKVFFPASDQPLTRPDASDETRLEEQQNSAISGTILIVDDEESIRETATAILEDMGLQTLTAIDGQHALEVYREHAQEIRLVLLDMTMPRMDGKRCFSELRQMNPDIKVILSSGYSEQDAMHPFLAYDATAFVQKPYTPEMLEKKIHAILSA